MRLDSVLVSPASNRMWRTKLCSRGGCGKIALQGEDLCEACAKLPQSEINQRVRHEWDAWYGRWPWTGEHGLRSLVIRHNPICQICDRNPSTIADHIIPHKGNWDLFTDFKNLQGLCKECHDRKTASEDGGFGHYKDFDAVKN